MADVTNFISTYRGWLIPAHFWLPENLWAAESTYTEAWPLPPSATPTADTDLVLEVSGTIWAAADLEVQGHRAGFAGPDKGATIYRIQGDTYWLGWDAPNLPTDWEPIVWTDVATSATRDPDSVTLSDGTLVTVYQGRTAIAPGYHVRCAARDPSDGTIAITDIYSQTTAPTHGFFPCVVVLPSDRLLCFHWVEDATNNLAQVRAHVSDDSGATWSVWQPYCLVDAIDIATWSLRRLRAAYAPEKSQISMLAGLYQAALANDFVFLQLASSDLGATLEAITTGDGSSLEAYPDIIASGAGFALAYIDSADSIVYKELAHAFIDHSDLAGDAVAFAGLNAWSAAGTGDGDLALTIDEDEALYLLARDTTNGSCYIKASTDGGDNWEFMSNSPRGANIGIWSDFNDVATYPRYFSATHQGGRLVVAHNWAANPGNEDDSLGLLYLGGPSTHTLPGLDAFAQVIRRVGWTHTWYAIELPGDTFWAAAGAGTEVLTDGWDQITTTAAQARYFDDNPAGTVAEGMGGIVHLLQASGGTLVADDIAARLRLADGVSDYDVSIRFTDTAFRVVDNNNGGATIDSVTGIDTTNGFQLIYWLGEGTFYCAYRETADTQPHRYFLPGPSSSTVSNDGATPAANNLIRWGHIAVSAAESWWRMHHYTSDEYAGLGWAGGPTLPDDLLPRCLSASAVELYGGAKIAASDGPIGRGDHWDLDARHRYPVEAVFAARTSSSLEPWRSEDDTVEVTIAVACDPALLGVVESRDENDVIALDLRACNWRTAYLEGYDVGGATWVTVATIDMAHNLEQLNYSRTGVAIEPANASPDQPYLFLDECRGWTVDLGSSKLRKVAATMGGKWDVTGRRAVLVLEGVDNTEPASGTASLWAKDAVIVVNLAGATYAGYRLRIPVQSTADGDFRVGAADLGPVFASGWFDQPGWGRAIEMQERVLTTERPDGSRRSRVLGESLRVVEVGWTDGIDQQQASGGSASPDYYAGTTTGGARGIGTRGALPVDVQALIRRLRGAASVATYLPRIAVSTGAQDVQILNRREQSVRGTFSGPVRRDTVQGQELENEVSRVPKLVLTELP